MGVEWSDKPRKHKTLREVVLDAIPSDRWRALTNVLRVVGRPSWETQAIIEQLLEAGEIETEFRRIRSYRRIEGAGG